MTTLPRELATVRIADNETHLYYRLDGVRFEDSPSITLGTLAPDPNNKKSVIVPDDQVQALANRYAETPIWQRVGSDDPSVDARGAVISNDLHPAIRSLLSGARPDLAKRWQLAPEAARFLERADLYEEGVPHNKRSTKTLQMECRSAAAERLTNMGVEPCPLQISVINLQLLTLRTDVAYLVAHVSFARSDGAEMTAYDTIEGVHAVSRFNECRWVAAIAADAEQSEEAEPREAKNTKCRKQKFSMGELLRRFVQPAVPDRALSNRVNSYVHLRTADHCEGENLDVLATFLARRYTADYLLEPATSRTTNIREFANIRHAVTDEGLASVMSPATDGTLPHFLQSWKANAFRNAYSPAVLLKLHEDWYLTTGRAKAFSALEADKPDIIDVLDDMVHDCLIFRMFFRFSSVSSISMHNSVAQAIRTHLSLDRKLDEMQGDVEAMVDRLGAAQKEEETRFANKRHLETYWIGNLAGAALMAFAVFAVAKDFLPALFDVFSDMVPDQTKTDSAGNEGNNMAIWVAFLLALAVGLASLSLGWLKRPAMSLDRRDIRRKLDAIRVLLIRN